MEEVNQVWIIVSVWRARVLSVLAGIIKMGDELFSLTDEESGRQLEVWTTEPGMQVYMGNWIEGEFPHKAHNAVALECQHYPDSPNHPSFPSTILNPGEVYTQTTIFKFKSLVSCVCNKNDLTKHNQQALAIYFLFHHLFFFFSTGSCGVSPSTVGAASVFAASATGSGGTCASDCTGCTEIGRAHV